MMDGKDFYDKLLKRPQQPTMASRSSSADHLPIITSPPIPSDTIIYAPITGPPTRRHWMSDTASTVCLKCSEPFTLIIRRHHCRRCGLLYCGSCCSVTFPFNGDRIMCH
jgi:hypothetical protein